MKANKVLIRETVLPFNYHRIISLTGCSRHSQLTIKNNNMLLVRIARVVRDIALFLNSVLLKYFSITLIK